MNKETICHLWKIKVYNPEQFEEPTKDREVLIEDLFASITKAADAINEAFKPYSLSISSGTLSKLGAGIYYSKTTTLSSSIEIVKVKCSKKYVYTILEEIRPKNHLQPGPQ